MKTQTKTPEAKTSETKNFEITFELPQKIALLHLQEKEQISLTVQANENEKQALAKRFGLHKLHSLVCATQLTYEEDYIKITGHLKARAQQSCVVSLKPVSENINIQFEQRLCQDPNMVDDRLDGPDIELLQTPDIFIGEIIAQQLGLSLNPYPRLSSASIEKYLPSQKSSPFAVLQQLKAKNDNS